MKAMKKTHSTYLPTYLPTSQALLAFVIVLSMGSTLVFGAAPPAIEWQKTFGGSGIEVAYAVEQTTDGGYIIAAETWSFSAGGPDVYLVKTDSAGVEQWHRTFGGTGDDRGFDVRQTPDGGYIVIGETTSFGAGGMDAYLIKTDSAGIEQWHQTYGTASTDAGRALDLTADGGYIIAGGTSAGVYLLKTDSAGVEQWHQGFGGAEDSGSSVQQTPDGGYIVTGEKSGDVYLLKTDSLGVEQWHRTFGGAGRDYGGSVDQTADGGYVIAGPTLSYGPSSDVYCIRTDSAGNPLWEKTYGGTGDDRGHWVRETPDGGYVITGMTSSLGAGSWDVYVLKTDSAGNVLWEALCGGGNYDSGYSVQPTRDGGYVVAGTTYSLGAGGDVYLIKLEPSETQPPNSAPMAKCKNVQKSADQNCQAGVSPQEVDNGSSDPDGDTITVSLSPSGPYPLGETAVTLTVTDEHGASAQCTAKITVEDDTAPSPMCPGDITVGNDPGQCSAVVNYEQPDAIDNCDGEVEMTCEPASGSPFPVGETAVVCTAVDDAGNRSTCSFKITVQDRELPVVTVIGEPVVLWPPNHEHATIDVARLVTVVWDNCMSLTSANVVIAGVTSDEPEDATGGGDGSTLEDIVIASDCRSVALRRERQGDGNGRVYTIHLAVADAAGNEGTASVQVQVPHNMGEPVVDDGPAYGVTGCDATP